MLNKRNIFWPYLAVLLAANLTLLLPNANPLRIIGALLLIGFLPGLAWATRFLSGSPPLLRYTIAAALSYTFTVLTTLLLHYLPGPVLTWQLLVILNLLAILPVITTRNREAKMQGSKEEVPLTPARLSLRTSARTIPIPLLLILLIALFLRLANLHYSEFQGDEALAMISAAEALEGHENALFLRSKGPAEVLLPIALWRLTGTISEPIARLPFTIAAMFAIVTIYLIGQTIAGERAGWIAAGFFAFSGFMVAFGRIVQYQALVVWMSAAAFLLIMQWRATRRYRWVVLAGLFLGTGLLAHYDAILVLPAIIWLFIPMNNERRTTTKKEAPRHKQLAVSSQIINSIKAGLLFLAVFLLTALTFYLPYALDPQANRTGEYVGNRIGNELRNNLPDFFHFNTFYSSFYYVLITGLLVAFFFLWILWQTGTPGRIFAAIAALGIVAVIFSPDALGSLSFLPFASLFLAAFLALFSKKLSSPYLQSLIIWLAIPFLGYNFVVALGLTHIYTIVPAWSLLAALGWQRLPISNYQLRINKHRLSLANILLTILFALFAIFLWNSFVRHDIEYKQDYPKGNLSLFWTPYPEPPQAGFFGFAHRTGWKAVGQKIIGGTLTGDYGSNEEPDITTWYTRGAPRACDPQPEFYFLADDLIDPVSVPEDVLKSGYEQIAAVTLPNQKQMRIMQQTPGATPLETIDEATLARAFDSTTEPSAFARSARGSLPAEANFGNLVRLIGYDLDTRRAYPGGRVPVTLYWQALASIPTGYQVFTHLESASGPAAQSDGVPVCWTYPTDVWRPGQIIADQHAISLSPGISPGQYPLEIGLYLPDTFERLDVLDEAGNPAGTSVTLDMIEIRKLGD